MRTHLALCLHPATTISTVDTGCESGSLSSVRPVTEPLKGKSVSTASTKVLVLLRELLTRV